jgi:hypothetical protein
MHGLLILKNKVFWGVRYGETVNVRCSQFSVHPFIIGKYESADDYHILFANAFL